MRTPIAAGGLLPAGKTSTATTTIFQQLPLGFCLTKEIKSRTSNQYPMDYSSFWKLKAIETKSRQTLVFHPGGSAGHLRACPLLGTWRALLCGKIFVRALDEAAAFFGGWMTRSHHLAGEGHANRLHRTYCRRLLFLRRQAGLKMSCRQRRRETI